MIGLLVYDDLNGDKVAINFEKNCRVLRLI